MMTFKKITIEPCPQGMDFDFEFMGADGTPLHHMIRVERGVSDDLRWLFPHVLTSIEERLADG